MIRFRSYSIQRKMMLFFILIAVLLFLTIGFLFIKSTEGAIKSSKRNELITLSNETANKIDRFILERYGDLQVMAASPLLKNKDIEKGLKLDYMESVRNVYRTYDYILTTDSRGSIQLISGDMKGDSAYKKWLPSVLNGKTVVSDFTYLRDEGVFVVYFASPILNGNKVAGAVVERMNFNAITDIVKKVKIGQSGYAYLMSDDGVVIQNSNPDIAAYGIVEENDDTASITEHQGEKYITAFHGIRKYDTQLSKWYLVVDEPYKEAFLVVSNLRNYTLVLLMISVIALAVLAAIMSEIITKPIKKLVADTQSIALGNLGQSIKIDSQDEIGSIAHAFTAIQSSLKSMMQQVLDISGEAASLEEIRQYADRFFENLPSAILTISNMGIITSMNNIAVDITGIPKEALLGRNISDINDINIRSIVDLLADGINKQITYKKHITKVRNKSDKELLIMVNTTIQKDSNSKIIGVIGAFKLVDEIRDLEESVIRAKNLSSLGALSAGMAHEIRNPLTSIKGYAQFIKSELKQNDELTQDISIIINEVDRLNGIIDRFLSFARPQKLKLCRTNINNIVNGVIKLISKDMGDANIQIAESYADLPEIEIDQDQLEQALLNIVINSIQAMDQGGTLSVSTDHDRFNDYIEVKIADTGIGIEEKDIDSIFEPFYTTKEKGTGLGLAICSRIIEDHRGFLEVTSKPGTGTEFTIKLPVKNEMQVKK